MKPYGPRKFLTGWLICLGGTSLVLACGQDAGPAGGNDEGRAFPVHTAQAGAPEDSAYLRVPATIEPYEVIAVSSRVAGMVEQLHFVDGDTVKAGTALASIDRQRYLLDNKSAQAELQQARVTHDEAEQALQRREQIARDQPGVLSTEELSSARTRAAQTAADLAKAQSTADSRALTAQWSRVPAPRSGTLQQRLVSTGQYVQPGTPIVKLVQRDPMLLRFEIDSQVASRIERGAKVQAHSAEGQQLQGEVIFVGDTALPDTRQIAVTVRVTTPSRELRRLRGGESLDVSLTIKLPEQSVLVPDTAVRPTDKGYRTYVVQDGEALPRAIQIGARLEDGRIEVVRGLAAGEIVVVRGAEALREGAAVRILDGPNGSSSSPDAVSGPATTR